ncbi:esterase [Musicola keenii]|uniref:esterase n=1 Tax=Musicola keenii TaxID=2884250 RepID=UPI00177C58E4|nr:esterase [Musicola keenii]
MSVEIDVDHIHGVEVLHAFPAGGKQRPLPTVFFFHGFTSSKEAYCYFPYTLARAGFRVIAPDALMHGARFDGDDANRWRYFWDIMLHSVDELPMYVDACRERGWIDGVRIGACGASMGAMTALAAMTRYPWLRAVASFMGAGHFTPLCRTLFPPVVATTPGAEPILAALAERVAGCDALLHLERLSDRPLLLWHGLADEVVPARESECLRQALVERGWARQLTWLTEDGIGHKITPGALQASANFFLKSL